jgi:hypothetical protein
MAMCAKAIAKLEITNCREWDQGPDFRGASQVSEVYCLAFQSRLEWNSLVLRIRVDFLAANERIWTKRHEDPDVFPNIDAEKDWRKSQRIFNRMRES